MAFHYLTANEAADAVGVTRRTLTRWIADGRIEPAAKLPGATGALLFHPDDVARLAAERAASC